MTYEQFVEILAELDKRCDSVEMFNCRPTELVPGQRFGYDFNGFLPCVAIFRADGGVYDGQDVYQSTDPNEVINFDSPYWKFHPSVEAYKDALVNQFMAVLEPDLGPDPLGDHHGRNV